MSLRRNPRKQREWETRSRAAALERSRDRTQGSTPERTPRPSDRPISRPEGPLSPLAWRREVWELDEGRCVNCGEEVPRDGSMWVWNAHHPVEKQKLPPELRWDPENGVVLCRGCHEGHHDGTTFAVLGQRLPARCRRFAARLGAWAVDVLDRAHPTTTDGGQHGEGRGEAREGAG